MSAAVECFALACRFAFQLPPALGLAWWEGLHSSRHRQCTWIVRRLDRFKGTAVNYGAWFLRVLPPKPLIEACEVLHREGHLSRQAASTIQEAILGLMRQGDWK